MPEEVVPCEPWGVEILSALEATCKKVDMGQTGRMTGDIEMDAQSMTSTQD